MIVGTAGHIDHGKSTLVRALTGVDTDRLPEEKARGISIELGYAYLDVPPLAGRPPPGRIGFVDVPGHERLVRMMLAGATGIDYALLVVAADDGVMPQTREHLAVLALLGIERGAVVLTKADRVEAGRLAEVHRQVDELLTDTPLATLPVLPVASTTGAGLDALRALLYDAARRSADRSEPDAIGFRLAVDRSFALPGIGTVVTGTVHAGRVAVGDELVVAPMPGRLLRARVRSLHAADRPVATAGAGERCALGLAGLDRHEVGRGSWLVSPSIAATTTRIDVRLTVWRDEARPLRSGTPVHVHIGTADVLASVALLHLDEPAGSSRPPSDAVRPGRTAWVQLVLREPVAAWHGDRVVLRDASASRTLAGGRVLDPSAPARHRRTPLRLAEIAAWLAPTPAARLERLVEAAPLGVDSGRWAVAEGLLDVAAAWRIAPPHARQLEARALAQLQTFDTRHPDLPGLDAAALRRSVAPRLAEAPWRELLEGLRASGRIVLQASFVQLPGRAREQSAADATRLRRIEPLLAAAGYEGAWVRDLARSTNEDEASMRASLARLARQGAVHQIVKDLYLRVATLAELAALLRASAAGSGGAVAAATFRDAAGLGRKRAIQLLEYFDRLGVTTRSGDLHRIRPDSQLFA